MPFQAIVRGIENGFIVELFLPGELMYHEIYDKTLVEALSSILLCYECGHHPSKLREIRNNSIVYSSKPLLDNFESNDDRIVFGLSADCRRC
jgi:hypothetical protein